MAGHYTLAMALQNTDGSVTLWAALGGIVGLVFLELLKEAVKRGGNAAVKRAAEDEYRAQKLANCLERNEALTHERDTWREKYFARLEDRKK